MCKFISVLLALTVSVSVGCSSPPVLNGKVTGPVETLTRYQPVAYSEGKTDKSDEPDEPESALAVPEELAPGPSESIVVSEVTSLPELVNLTVENHPRLAEVSWAVNAARGQAVQAGLYPNPSVDLTGNELGDRTGPGGIWSLFASQEIVTANKLELSEAAKLKEVDQASLTVVSERYRLLTDVRQAFFEALTLQRRAEILTNLVQLAEESVSNANELMKAKEAAELDVVQLEVDLERYRTDLQATRQALPGVYQKLAASVGRHDLPISKLVGDLETQLPDYDLNEVRWYVLGIHPEIRSAQIGVEQARLELCRAEVEPIPNVTVGAGYTHQSQNRSEDWDIGVSLPIPVWNKNQGNILTAQSRVHRAANQVGVIENEIATRLSAAFATYSAARERSERYKTAILPKAERTYELSRKAYQGGQFEYLRVLQAQRAVAETNLEYIRSLGEMWQAASQIAGLMLEDQWPLTPVEPAQ